MLYIDNVTVEKTVLFIPRTIMADVDNPGAAGAAGAAGPPVIHVFVDEGGVVQDAEDSALSRSTIDNYAGFIGKYAKYCKDQRSDQGVAIFSHQLMQPPVQPVEGEPWRNYTKVYKTKHPCWRFQKTPCQIDWRVFDIGVFKTWLLQHQRTAKPNGKYPSFSKNSKSTSAIKWAFLHANVLTNGELDNMTPPPNIDTAMRAVKKVMIVLGWHVVMTCRLVTLT